MRFAKIFIDTFSPKICSLAKSAVHQNLVVSFVLVGHSHAVPKGLGVIGAVVFVFSECKRYLQIQYREESVNSRFVGGWSSLSVTAFTVMVPYGRLHVYGT